LWYTFSLSTSQQSELKSPFRVLEYSVFVVRVISICPFFFHVSPFPPVQALPSSFFSQTGKVKPCSRVVCLAFQEFVNSSFLPCYLSFLSAQRAPPLIHTFGADLTKFLCRGHYFSGTPWFSTVSPSPLFLFNTIVGKDPFF